MQTKFNWKMSEHFVFSNIIRFSSLSGTEIFVSMNKPWQVFEDRTLRVNEYHSKTVKRNFHQSDKGRTAR